MFCKHKWRILSETTTESKIEVARKALGGMGCTHMPHQLCDADRVHIQILTCEKCGKLVKFTERI